MATKAKTRASENRMRLIFSHSEGENNKVSSDLVVSPRSELFVGLVPNRKFGAFHFTFFNPSHQSQMQICRAYHLKL